MPATATPKLVPGRVYRTRAFAKWDANAPRLVKRLVREGKLLPLAHGLYAHPKQGRFGAVPPSDNELLRAFLDDAPFVFAGPDRWNALGLGSTAVFAAPLVYNTKRSGTFKFGSRTFTLRRVAFPKNPTPEWYAVDLLENAPQAGVERTAIARAITGAIDSGRLDATRLYAMAEQFGTQRTRNLLNAQRAAVSR